MRAWHRLWLLPATGMLLAAACFGGGDAPAGAGASPTPQRTPTPAAAPDPWPPVATARITTDDLNVRVGPAVDHAVLGRLQSGDEVTVSGYWEGGKWLALPGIGWVAYTPEWVDLSVELLDLPAIPEREFAFNGPLHPPAARADIPVVDAVIGPVVGGDRQGVRSLLRLRLLDCVEDSGIGERPQCPQGVDEGTEVEVVATAACEVEYAPVERLDEVLDRFYSSDVVGERPLRPYAVVRAPGEGADPDYVAVFGFEGGEGRWLRVSPDGNITQIGFGCDAMPPGYLLRVGPQEPFFWLRPPVPPPLDPIR